MSKPDCPEDWQRRRIGDCWTKTNVFQAGPDGRGYVHPKGWVVDPRCLADPRLQGEHSLTLAMDKAWAKLSPGVPVERGGCLSRYNPRWGADLVEKIWTRRVFVSCPPGGRRDPNKHVCADNSGRGASVPRGDGGARWVEDQYQLTQMQHVESCVGGPGGVSAIVFHETLHAAGVPTDEHHNQRWTRPQLEFVYDRVYGAEALCFFGVDPALRSKINFLQCKNAATYQGHDGDWRTLCAGFDASFTDQYPQGFLKH